MIPKECKRLAEVDFPIAVVSAHSAREKSIRHGHPSTLHLWWARRPLAACRAMLLALLLPDPCDENCPADFKEKSRKILSPLPGCASRNDEELRKAILKFIGDFANWDLAANGTYLEASRALVKAAYPEETPLVVDPFAGGGSIPLEALRIGCDTFASDLNPVACLIEKVMLEDIPRHGPKLAEELRKVGAEIKEKAEKELAEFYPVDPDGSRPIAYLWARTVRCESPNCGAEIPLMRSFWLCKKDKRKRALKYNVKRPKDQVPFIEFQIFEPKNESEVPVGTVARAKAKCLCCGNVLSPDRVRAQLSAQKGGADVVFDKAGKRTGGARLLSIVTLNEEQMGRQYRLANEKDYGAVWKANKRVAQIVDEWEKGGKKGLCPVPDEKIPTTELRRLSIPLYGCNDWGLLYNFRQAISLVTFTNLLKTRIKNSGDNLPLGILALSISKQAERLSSYVTWITQTQAPRGTYARQAVGMVWDYAELVPLWANNEFIDVIDSMVNVIEQQKVVINVAQVENADATNHPLANESVDIWFTDPPYYDSVPYAHLSDLFHVWLRRIISDNSYKGAKDILTPKDLECVVDRPHKINPNAKTAVVYEKRMGLSMSTGARIINNSGIGCVVFAHKDTQGWESLIGGMCSGGLVVTGSWPVLTERGGRLNAQEQAALATSVHLVCRPRPADAPIGDWSHVYRELPKRVSSWMERLQSEGIRGADLVFACIGPALEIYSRYSKVVDENDREIPLGGDPASKEPYKRGYLAYVWEVVGRCALEQVLGTAEASARNSAAGALEEDSRLTALFLWTMQSTDEAVTKKIKKTESSDEDEEETDDEESGKKKSKKKGLTLIYDVVRRFAQPLGIQLPAWEGRIIEIEKGIVRLLPVSERGEQLFGDEGAKAVADIIEESPPEAIQLSLLPDLNVPNGSAPKIKGRGKRKTSAGPSVSDDNLRTRHEATTLDRVHAAMLLQAAGRTNALRALLKSEIERGPDFLRLANALSALYPKTNEEKRLLDAMLLAVPR